MISFKRSPHRTTVSVHGRKFFLWLMKSEDGHGYEVQDLKGTSLGTGWCRGSKRDAKHGALMCLRRGLA